MKRLIICTFILHVCIDAYLQEIPQPPEITFYHNDQYEIYKENVNGLDVYKWMKNSKKISEYVRLSCTPDWGGGIYRGYSGKGLFVDGLRHGKWKLEKCDTGIEQEISYNKGLITGYYKVFFGQGTTKNGKWIKSGDSILYETNFMNGNGEWKNFYGSTREFAIRETGYYKDGKKSGEWRYYTPRGFFLHRKEYYEKGILIGYEEFEIPEELIEYEY
jgi:hypothetical protein